MLSGTYLNLQGFYFCGMSFCFRGLLLFILSILIFAKIMDFGKYQYAENKKQKASKAKAHTAEVKTLQIKIGTGEHDLSLKAKKAGEWLREGHRVRLDLFLPGRAKYLN